MLARQQADSSKEGFAKLAPFFFFFYFIFLFFFYFSIWAPRVFLAIAMVGGLRLGPS